MIGTGGGGGVGSGLKGSTLKNEHRIIQGQHRKWKMAYGECSMFIAVKQKF